MLTDSIISSLIKYLYSLLNLNKGNLLSDNKERVVVLYAWKINGLASLNVAIADILRSNPLALWSNGANLCRDNELPAVLVVILADVGSITSDAVDSTSGRDSIYQLIKVYCRCRRSNLWRWLLFDLQFRLWLSSLTKIGYLNIKPKCIIGNIYASFFITNLHLF